MSDNRITIGLVAPLLVPVTDVQREELCDKLDPLKLDINYEGTLLFFVVKDGASYDFDICIGNPANPDAFKDLSVSAGVPIQYWDTQSFFAHWYDGSDSPMSTMTLEQFKNE